MIYELVISSSHRRLSFKLNFLSSFNQISVKHQESIYKNHDEIYVIKSVIIKASRLLSKHFDCY